MKASTRTVAAPRSSRRGRVSLSTGVPSVAMGVRWQGAGALAGWAPFERRHRRQRASSAARVVRPVGAAPAEQRPGHANRRVGGHGRAALEVDEQRRALRGKLRVARHVAQQPIDSRTNAHFPIVTGTDPLT